MLVFIGELGMTKKGSVFALLTKWEKLLWLLSVLVVLGTFLLFQSKDVLSLIASLIGVSALIFVSTGQVFGQVLIIIFAVLYGIASLRFRYYGEMITYLGMSAPMAICALVSWIRHPYKDKSSVEVGSVSKKQAILMCVSGILVTVAFYFILGAFNTANLTVSTASVLTSFIASYLTFLRSPFYALAYAINDVVLIVLWILATISDPSVLPMIFCFVMFLVNDLYGFFNWCRMRNRQASEGE